MNQNLYLNYAVYNNTWLVRVTSGYFASDAWKEGDEQFSKILGTKFGGIFGDDGKKAICSKAQVRRLSSDEEYKSLLESSCLRFKNMMQILDALYQIHKEHQKTGGFNSIKEYLNITDFEEFGYGLDIFKEPLTVEDAKTVAKVILNAN